MVASGWEWWATGPGVKRPMAKATGVEHSAWAGTQHEGKCDDCKIWRRRRTRIEGNLRDGRRLATGDWRLAWL